MDQIPSILYADEDFTTWLILGASRGIGLEFVRQLLSKNDRIIATVREPFAAHASALWGQAGGDHGRCRMEICDILSEESIVVCSVHVDLFWILRITTSRCGCMG
jgi:NAD(P)-dependent dehydrogenase (short-subunit alcohol dehydrogenase family)